MLNDRINPVKDASNKVTRSEFFPAEIHMGCDRPGKE